MSVVANRVKKQHERVSVLSRSLTCAEVPAGGSLTWSGKLGWPGSISEGVWTQGISEVVSGLATQCLWVIFKVIDIIYFKLVRSRGLILNRMSGSHSCSKDHSRSCVRT
jgi:hypothetical protein